MHVKVYEENPERGTFRADVAVLHGDTWDEVVAELSETWHLEDGARYVLVDLHETYADDTVRFLQACEQARFTLEPVQ